MAKRKRKQQWSKIIRVGELDVRLYERKRGASVYYSYRLDGRKVQKSTRRSDRVEAEVYARAQVEEVLEEARLGRTGEPMTLGELFRAYFRWKAPTLSRAWRKAAKMRSELFLEAWGKDTPALDVGQTHVDAYSAARRAGKLSPLGRGGRGDRDPVKVRDGTLDGDFRWLSSVYNWARRHKVDGERLVPENPLTDVTWPKEKNPRRPVASHQRFVATMEHVDEVDDEGRLRCIVALARWTGRRESAICELQADDVLRTEEAVRRALATSGMDERLAQHMPHGAIRWSEEKDKMGLLRIAPLSSAARRELHRYLARNPRVGGVPLFPAPEDPTKPIRRDTAASWLLKAEKLAELPKLRGGTFHPYRRLWASERKHMPDVDVAAVGGWKDTRALKMSYQQADPATALRVVENGG